MKKISILFFILGGLYACQKETNPSPVPPIPSASCQLVRITQGFNKDSIQHIIYDQQGRIVSVDDSVSKSLDQAVYDNNNRLIQINTDISLHPVTIDYNTQGLPSKVVHDYYSLVTYTYTYEYAANGLPLKRTLNGTYPDGSAPFTEYRSYAYAGRDIARTLDYSGADSSINATVTEYTFAADSNIFKPFIFYEQDVLYGYLEIMDLDYYFNNHLVASKTSFSKTSPNLKDFTVNTYTYDSLHMINGSTSKLTSTAGTQNNRFFTRQFFYNCK